MPRKTILDALINTSISHLCSRLGVISAKAPAVPRDDLDPVESINKHQAVHADAQHLCVEYLRRPSESLKEEALIALYNGMSEDLRLHDLVRRHGAPEFNLHIDLGAHSGR